MEKLSIKRTDHAVRGFTEPQRFSQHRVENRAEITGRRIDDLQNLGGRGLLFERLVAFGGALGKLASQIGDNPLRVSQRAVWWCFHRQTFGGPSCCSIIRRSLRPSNRDDPGPERESGIGANGKLPPSHPSFR